MHKIEFLRITRSGGNKRPAEATMIPKIISVSKKPRDELSKAEIDNKIVSPAIVLALGRVYESCFNFSEIKTSRIDTIFIRKNNAHKNI